MIDWTQVIACKPLKNALQAIHDCEEIKPYKPSEIDYLLRNRAWQLYEAFLLNQKSFQVTELIEGICSVQNFYQKIIKNPSRLNWILTPETDNLIMCKILREKALEQAYQLMDLNPLKQDGNLNDNVLVSQVALIEAIMKVNIV